MLSFSLFGHHDGIAGALNLYGDRRAAFDGSSLDVGSLYASHAAIALHGAQRVAGLTEGLRSRDVARWVVDDAVRRAASSGQ